jgi:hypothetical protein
MDPSTPGTERASTVTPGVPASQPTWNDSFSQVDTYAEQLRVKLPLAPPGLLNGYMNVAPWIAMIFGALGVLFLLVGLVGISFLAPLAILFGGAEGVGFSAGAFLALIVGLVTAALEFVGGYLMLQRKATGWWILALGIVVSLLTNLVHGAILTLIIVLLIAYIHLSVKPNYR